MKKENEDLELISFQLSLHPQEILALMDQLVKKKDWIKPMHSACYMVLVKNDALIDKFDADTGKVVYSDSLSFNFGNFIGFTK